ncbi:hypothetical protein KR038_006422 [Drosophila bunnanda]|nr:hypothetical protein KR038_006422 [Drosophila bunnanda]
MQDQEEMTRKRGRTRNRSKQRSRRRSCRQRREGKPLQRQQRAPQPSAREQWAMGAEMCIQTSRILFEWHHNQVMNLCRGLRQQEGTNSQRTPHCLDYVYESSSEEEDLEEEDEEEEQVELDPEPIDEGYLKFLEVTIKHQEELRRKRADTTTASLDELGDKS